MVHFTWIEATHSQENMSHLHQFYHYWSFMSLPIWYSEIPYLLFALRNVLSPRQSIFADESRTPPLLHSITLKEWVLSLSIHIFAPFAKRLCDMLQASRHDVWIQGSYMLRFAVMWGWRRGWELFVGPGLGTLWLHWSCFYSYCTQIASFFRIPRELNDSCMHNSCCPSKLVNYLIMLVHVALTNLQLMCRKITWRIWLIKCAIEK